MRASRSGRRTRRRARSDIEAAEQSHRQPNGTPTTAARLSPGDWQKQKKKEKNSQGPDVRSRSAAERILAAQLSDRTKMRAVCLGWIGAEVETTDAPTPVSVSISHSHEGSERVTYQSSLDFL